MRQKKQIIAKEAAEEQAAKPKYETFDAVD
jgi:hypothetical protein